MRSKTSCLLLLHLMNCHGRWYGPGTMKWRLPDIDRATGMPHVVDSLRERMNRGGAAPAIAERLNFGM